MSTKRLQIVLSQEAWAAVESLATEANNSFESGHINYSNLINEMILSAKIDIKSLQLKHTDLKRSLRVLASQKNIDLDTAIRTLSELKQKVGKKTVKTQLALEESTNG